MYQEKIKTIDAIQNFPIGESAKNRVELLCKAELVSHLSQYESTLKNMAYQYGTENVEDMVRNFLEKQLDVQKDEVIPDIASAKRYLKLADDFIEDIGKIKYVKENDPNYNMTYEIITSQLQKEQSLTTEMTK